MKLDQPVNRIAEQELSWSLGVALDVQGSCFFTYNTS